jgi:hypothetical protein
MSAWAHHFVEYRQASEHIANVDEERPNLHAGEACVATWCMGGVGAWAWATRLPEPRGTLRSRLLTVYGRDGLIGNDAAVW